MGRKPLTDDEIQKKISEKNPEIPADKLPELVSEYKKKREEAKAKSASTEEQANSALKKQNDALNFIKAHPDSVFIRTTDKVDGKDAGLIVGVASPSAKKAFFF